jgi:hypothetical protein
MNMRWAWTLPVLTLATALVSGPVRGQTAAAPAGGASYPAAGQMPVDPAVLAAMQSQAWQAQAYGAPPGQPGGPAMYPQPALPQSPEKGQRVTVFVPDAAMPAGPMPAAMYPQGMYAQGMYPQNMYSQGVMPASYMAPVQAEPGQPLPMPMPMGATPDAYGAYGYAPSDLGSPAYGGGGMPMYDQGGYGGPMGPMGPMGMYDGGYGGPMYDGQSMMDGCPFCGGYGCPQCGGHGGLFGHRGDGTHLPNGLLGDVLGLVAPYPDGGCAAVRWFDFAVDYMMLKRDNTGRSQPFTSRGTAGPIVLETDDLDFGGYRPGFRFIGALQIGPANSVEFTYFGQFHHAANAVVRSPNANLFSVFSEFGINPFGGFSEFDRANFQQISYTSSFDSFEIDWRCRWMSPNCRYQGSWTIGARHFILDEKFRFNTVSGPNGFPTATGFEAARSTTDVDTTNNLTGIQFGSDLWICLLPGLRAGGEVKAGVYGNHMNVNTTVGSNLIANDFFEFQQANDVAFIGQANLLATYRINYQWTLRGGYTFLYVDGVALASENFNPLPPLVNNPFRPRVPFVNDNGNVFYHGWNVGVEFMW